MYFSPKVDAYIAGQPPSLQPLFEACRQVIMQAAPKIVEDIKWSVPFYSYHGMLCYLSPNKKGVLWGFCRGASLSNEFGLFQGKDRKMIRHILIENAVMPHQEEVLMTLQEALLWNEQAIKK